MAERKSFILYTDMASKIQRLSREEKGALLEAILAFENDEPVPDDMPAGAAIAFDFIEPQLAENKEAYAKVSEGRRKAANARWADAKNANASDASANDASGDDTDTDTDKEKEPPKGGKKEKPEKHQHGIYQHVMLTDRETMNLLEEYGAEKAQDAINFLDEYIERKHYKAASHYLCIKKWVMNAMEEEQVKRQELERRQQRLKGTPKEKAGITRGTDFDSVAVAQLFGG